MDHYAAVKKNENELYELMGNDFQVILLSEKKKQSSKDYLWRFLKKLGLNLPYVLWSCKVLTSGQVE